MEEVNVSQLIRYLLGVKNCSDHAHMFYIYNDCSVLHGNF